MSVYVDWLCAHGWVLRGRRIKSCHMFADSEAELVQFAGGIGLKPRWLQTKNAIHFDLTEGKRLAAVGAGAIELDRDTFRAAYYEARRQATERAERSFAPLPPPSDQKKLF